MPRLVVIGGGVSGLASGWTALKQLGPGAVQVLEAGPVVGGTIRSESEAGFISESGPCALLAESESLVSLFDDLGLELIPAAEVARRRYIRVEGSLRRFPASWRDLLTGNLLSKRGLLRVAMEPWSDAELQGDESVASYARRRLGQEGAVRLLGPIVAGIYAGDPERLSARSALPRLVGAVEARGSLLKALLGAAGPRRAGARSMTSLAGGMGELPQALGRALGKTLCLNSPVNKIGRVGDRWCIEVGGERPREIEAEAVVVATSPRVTRHLVEAHDSKLAEAVGGIDTQPVVVVSLGYRRASVEHPLDGYGYLVSPEESGPVLGVQWASSMFPGHRAPDGHVLIQVFMGGVRNPGICEMDDHELVAAAGTEIGGPLGIEEAPVHVRVFRHQLGLPQYEVGHAHLLDQIQQAQDGLPGLELAGNAFSGVGIAACVDSGISAAQRGLAFIAQADARERAIA